MNRVRGSGRRFDNEPKLNMKKVFATIVAIAVIVMVIVSMINLFKKDKNNENEMIIPKRYFTIFESGKYGVIDGTGNIILNSIYDEMIIIPNSEKPLFISVYDTNPDTGTYKTKVLDEKGKEILKDFEDVEPLENSKNNEIWYEDNVLRFQKDGKYGLINFSGEVLLPAEYTNIYALNGVQKSIIVEKDNLKGVFNSALGNLIIACDYNEIKSLNKETTDDGYIVGKDGKYGVLNGTGKEILSCNYLEVKNVYGNNLYVVRDDSGTKVIDNSLNIVKNSGFDEINEINGEYITFTLGGKKGVLNKIGTELITAQYEDLKYACDDYFIAKMNGLYGIIKLDGSDNLDFKYTSISFIDEANFYTAENSDYTTDVINKKLETKLSKVIISELNTDKTYLRVRENGEYKYYNFNFEEKKNSEILTNRTLFLAKKDGKYGYVNKNGDLIVNYIYDDAKEQNEFGYCAVKQNGKWGVLGKDGTIILKPSVNLNDYLYVDFISSWHLFNDINLNLYVK